jgi:signal transduction histidine kinase
MKSNLDCELITEFYDISHKILLRAKNVKSKQESLQEFFSMFCKITGCEFSEFWFKIDKKLYYFRYIAKSELPYVVESTVNKKGFDFLDDHFDNSELSSLCKKILKHHIDPTEPNYTSKGSYFSNKITPELSKKSDFTSLAIIPLDREKKRVGLLVLFTQKSKNFSNEKMELFENIIENFILALDYIETQFKCRERVKELTCLYGISRIAEIQDLSLETMLKRIVKCLPPAWLYPDLATARIVLDGKFYTTPNFVISRVNQKANIIIDGMKRGFIEVTYPEEKFHDEEYPFCKEESNLLNLIIRQIVAVVEGKKAESEKEKLGSQLRHADRLATIGQLSAGVAHEINEPLSYILGFAQLIQEGDELNPQSKKDIEKIITATLHAREVVKKLMIFSRQMPTLKTKVDLNDSIEKGLLFLESRCAKNNIQLNHFLTEEKMEIIADTSQLQQILVNLVVNAIQAMPEGGKLTIETKIVDDSAVLIVQDTGSGMPKDVLKQIFIPFFTTKDINQGTGLGLPVVHGIVTSHEGSINVESKVGKGTRFEVTLPLAK